LWVLVASLVDYYGVFGVGIRYTLQRYTARFSGKGAREELNTTLGSALGISAIVGIVLSVVAVLVAMFGANAFRLHGGLVPLFRELILLQVASVVVMLPAQVMGAHVCGLDRFDAANFAAVASAVLRAGLMWLAIVLGYGVLGVAGANLLVSGLSLVLQWQVLKYVDPSSALGWRHMSWARMRELVSFGFYVVISTTGNQLRFYSDSLVIAHWLSVALATPFNVAAKVMDYYRLAVYPVTGPLTSAMSAMDGRDEQARLKDLFLRSTRVCTLITLWVAVLIVVNGRELLAVWVGSEFASYYALLIVLTAGHVIALAQSPSSTILYARAQHKPLAMWTLGEGVINLALSIYWAPRYGLMGVALGTAVPMLIFRLGVQPWYVLRTLAIRTSDYIVTSFLRPLLVTALLAAVVRLAGHSAAKFGLVHLGLQAGWQTALFGAATLLFGVDGEDRKYLGAVFRRCMSRPQQWKVELQESKKAEVMTKG
jgi:O-antigen/teichoic acid export membrane protein